MPVGATGLSAYHVAWQARRAATTCPTARHGLILLPRAAAQQEGPGSRRWPGSARPGGGSRLTYLLPFPGASSRAQAEPWRS
jgi:hypothetical protein